MYSVNFSQSSTESSSRDSKNIAAWLFALSEIAAVVWLIIVLLTNGFDWLSMPSKVTMLIVLIAWALGLACLLVLRNKLSTRQRKIGVFHSIFALVITALFVAGVFTIRKLDSQDLSTESTKCTNSNSAAGVQINEC